MLLHVVDTAMTRVLGSETADRESDADERYLADVVEALHERGYRRARCSCMAPTLPKNW